MPIFTSIPRFLPAFLNRRYHALAKTLHLDVASPKFPSDKQLISALGQTPGGKRTVHGENKRLLVEQVRHGTQTRFFMTTEEISDAIRSLSTEFPIRAKALRSGYENWYSILNAKYHPDRKDSVLDWTAAPTGPGEDNLYRDRFQMFVFAPLLARAQVQGCDTRSELQQMLLTWVQRNYTASGSPGYASPLLCVFRITCLSWSLMYLLSAHSEDRELEWLMLKILFADVDYLDRLLGCSFGNNHLLADGFALWYAGFLFPQFRRSRHWMRRGEQIWLRELQRQILPDGCSFEHSIHYHELACEMASAYLLLNRKNRCAVSDRVRALICKMLTFHSAIAGPAARAPQIGDAVEDSLFPLDAALTCPTRSLQLVAAQLCSNATVADIDADDPDAEIAHWLLGARRSLPALDFGKRLQHFPDGGICILPDSDPSTRLIFRTGPREAAPVTPGHMHDDLLSIYLDIRGRAIIVEPGTYTYRSRRHPWPPTSPAWRSHFLSAAAHNGPYIEDTEPLDRVPRDFPSGQIASHVLTRIRADTTGLRWIEASIASQTLYNGHLRGVVHVTDQFWFIYDRFRMDLPRRLSFGFQFAPDCDVRIVDSNAIQVTTDHATLNLIASIQAPEIFSAKPSRPQGWVSPRYGVLAPSTMVRFPVSANRETNVAGFLLGSGFEHSRLELICSDGGIAMCCSQGDHRDILLLNHSGSDIHAFGFSFEGAVCWIRCKDNHVETVRWADARRLIQPEYGFRIEHPAPKPVLEFSNATNEAE